MLESAAFCNKGCLRFDDKVELHKLHFETIVVVVLAFLIFFVANDDLRDIIEQVFGIVMSQLVSMTPVVLGILYSVFSLEQIFAD